ncbi:hypothetical protein XELAEV_18007205mg [Xenopus laevis]|uniref:Olfactory receptor n=1 Tax=Xenopus laevis TaxID=8355 RepID=A0A974E1A0_XENLA|nr:hypothetical protein XELAEV_18007205mg [Xenopus laevis]
MVSTNRTHVTEFALRGFAGGPILHMILFVVLLLVFIFILAGNTFMIVIIIKDYRLHLPMYIFLVSLSFTETFINCMVVPKMLSIFIARNALISRVGCFAQCFAFYILTPSCFLFLGLMSIDRYAAVCHPLRYPTIMTNKACLCSVCACFIISFMCIFYPLITVPTLPICNHIVDHFFCEGEAIMKLFCVDTSILRLLSVISSVFILLGSLIITIISYIFIVSSVLKICSVTGRSKTFSTCISHLTMVSIVFGLSIFNQMRPHRNYFIELEKALIVGNIMVAPLLNPFVYTLRNQKVKDSIRDAIRSHKIF